MSNLSINYQLLVCLATLISTMGLQKVLQTFWILPIRLLWPLCVVLGWILNRAPTHLHTQEGKTGVIFSTKQSTFQESEVNILNLGWKYREPLVCVTRFILIETYHQPKKFHFNKLSIIESLDGLQMFKRWVWMISPWGPSWGGGGGVVGIWWAES